MPIRQTYTQLVCNILINYCQTRFKLLNVSIYLSNHHQYYMSNNEIEFLRPECLDVCLLCSLC